MKRWQLIAVVFLMMTFVILLAETGVYAATSSVLNEDMKFYARIDQGTILHSDDWAAIIFYRPPECVPDDFNLLEFGDPSAVNCTPLTVDGFIIQSGGPVPSTIQIKLNGLGAVPVWFVAWSELEAAVTDGMLTMIELESLPSLLVGLANFYTEIQSPGKVGKNSAMINCDAQGNLEDGRSFNVNALIIGDEVINVSIKFKGGQ